MECKADTKENKIIKLSEIFVQFLTLSIFAFGGGTTIISMMKDRFVDRLKWISEDEMNEMLTIVLSAPGATVINISILMAYRLRGIKGALIAILASILPPFIVIVLLLKVYKQASDSVIVINMLKGIKSAAAAIIVVVVSKMTISLIKKKNSYLIALFLIFFVLTRYANINVMILMFVSLIIGVLISCIKKHKEVKNDIN